MKGLLRAIAGRCETHDRAWYSVTARLEREAGMTASPPPASFTDEHANPDLIDCDNRRCRTKRKS